MRRDIAPILALLVVFLTGILGYRIVFSSETTDVVVLSVEGDVRRSDAAGATRLAIPGESLIEADRLFVPDGGSAALGFGADSIVRVQSSSSIRILEVDRSGVKMELEEGRLVARVREGSPALAISNAGRTFRASNASFSAGVTQDGVLLVAAEQGSLVVDGIPEHVQLVEGMELSLAPGKPALERELAETLLLSVSWPEAPDRPLATPLLGQTVPFGLVRLMSGGAIQERRADETGAFSFPLDLLVGEGVVEVQVVDPLGRSARESWRYTIVPPPPAVRGASVDWGGSLGP